MGPPRASPPFTCCFGSALLGVTWENEKSGPRLAGRVLAEGWGLRQGGARQSGEGVTQLLRAKDLGNDKVLVKSWAVVVSLGVSPAGLPTPHKKLILGGQRLLRGREGLSQTGSQLPPSEQPRGRASAQAPRSAPAPRAAPGQKDTPREQPAGSPGESPAQAAARSRGGNNHRAPVPGGWRAARCEQFRTSKIRLIFFFLPLPEHG